MLLRLCGPGAFALLGTMATVGQAQTLAGAQELKALIALEHNHNEILREDFEGFRRTTDQQIDVMMQKYLDLRLPRNINNEPISRENR